MHASKSRANLPRAKILSNSAIVCARRLQGTAHPLQSLGKLLQDAENLRGLVFGKLHQLVVGLHRFKRLDENGLPRSAGAVNDALHRATMFRPHRNHEAVVAQRHVVFTRLRLPRTHDLLQRFLDRIPSLQNAGANPAQAWPKHRR